MSVSFDPNPHLIRCLERTGHPQVARRILDNFTVASFWSPDPISFEQIDHDLYYYQPSIRPQTHLAIFDLDWTLTYGEKKLFPREADDIHLLPQRRLILERLFRLGYSLIVCTNQAARSNKERLARVARLTTFIEKLGLPVWVLAATRKESSFRKPNIGMWEQIQQLFPVIEQAFFCGDAAGRLGDFSDSDRQFANNAGITFYTPEEVFPATKETFPESKSLVILIGPPGSGKSTYSAQNLSGYRVLSQDVLKTKPRVRRELINSLARGINIALDATHPERSLRDDYRQLATQHGYTTTILYFVRDGRRGNLQRAAHGGKKIPDIAYHRFYKYLNPPTDEEGRVFKVWF